MTSLDLNGIIVTKPAFVSTCFSKVVTVALCLVNQGLICQFLSPFFAKYRFNGTQLILIPKVELHMLIIIVNLN